MRRLIASVLILAAAAWLHPLAAEEPWHEVQSSDDWFAISFPVEPKYSQSLARADSNFVVKTWATTRGAVAYNTSILIFPPFSGPRAPDTRYYTNLLKGYGGGAKAEVREQKKVTVAGHSAVEGIVDNAERNIHFLVDIVSISDRLYIVASGGPAGHEASEDAMHFRDSFRLTNY